MTDTLDETGTVVIPDELCEALLEALAACPSLGHVDFLRELGMPGTKGQIRAAVKAQLADEIAATRGDVIRREVARRAIEGWDEPVFHQGKQIGVVRRYDGRLLEFSARTYLPEARQQVDVNVGGPDGGPVRVEVDGGRVTTLGDVLDLALELGVPSVVSRLGLAAAAASREQLPVAQPLLPDPPDG